MLRSPIVEAKPPMPTKLRVDVHLYSLREAALWLQERGLRMPGGSEITYGRFMNYFGTLRRRGLGAVRVGRSWVIPDGELEDLEALWRKIAD